MPDMSLTKSLNILDTSKVSNIHENKTIEALKELVGGGDLDACIEVLKRSGATTFHISPLYRSVDKLTSQALEQLQDSLSPSHEALSYLVSANLAYQQKEFGRAGVYVADYKSLQYPEKSDLINKECLARMKEEIKTRREEKIKIMRDGNPKRARELPDIYESAVTVRKVIDAAQCRLKI